jgi:hypothetical protein
MKKFLTFSFLGALMALFAVSCSDDDLTTAVEEQQTLSKDGAYLKVRIQCVGDNSTRSTTDMGFEYGSEAEQAIHSVRFFFYDDNGFISEGEVYDEGDGKSSEHKDGEADGNVEYIKHDVVLAIDATTGRMPTSVVTIINPPTNLQRPETLKAFLDLGNAAAVQAGNKIQYYIKNGNTDYFTMATTSYYDGNSEAAADLDNDARRKSGNYYVTEIPTNCWYTTPTAVAADDANVLDIYVERLAVKVTVDIEKESSKLVKGNAENVYRLTYIPSGKTEAQDVNIIGGTGETDVYEADGTTPKTVYIKLHGWALNAKTQNTYLIKHLDPAWGKKMPSDFVWNDANNFRSYWGKSYNYGLKGDSFYVPTKYMSHTSADELEYIPMDDIDTEFGGSEYCNENTNDTSILKTAYLQMCTSALVLAQYVDVDGNKFSEPIVRYNNKLYTYNGYIEMVVKSVGVTLSGVPVTDDMFEVKSYDSTVSEDVKLNGRVAVQLAGKATTADYKWLSSAGTEMTPQQVNEALRKFNVSSDALGHNEGYMYYSIPIEHLGAQNAVTDLSTAEEGYFGVVRNHWYKLSIDEITGFGHGIVEKDEPIVPNPIDDSGMYLNAKINILSWKTLSQKVTL